MESWLRIFQATGTILALATLSFLPGLAAVGVTAPQDDGGSGGDAPDQPDGLIPIRSGEALTGAIAPRFVSDGAVPLVPDTDHYAFDAPAGATASVRIEGVEACVRLVGANGEPLDGGPWFNAGPICTLDTLAVALGRPALGEDAATIPEDGTYYVAVKTARAAGSTAYRVAPTLTAN